MRTASPNPSCIDPIPPGIARSLRGEVPNGTPSNCSCRLKRIVNLVRFFMPEHGTCSRAMSSNASSLATQLRRNGLNLQSPFPPVGRPDQSASMLRAAGSMHERRPHFGSLLFCDSIASQPASRFTLPRVGRERSGCAAFAGNGPVRTD
jgi:hypothetical protein